MRLGFIACSLAVLGPSPVLSFAHRSRRLSEADLRHLRRRRIGSGNGCCFVRDRPTMEADSPSPADAETAVPRTGGRGATRIDRSTLTLLEHVNLNVPSPDLALEFYVKVLGCGLDPRKASNLRPDSPKKTVWANCGASQFHLPHASIPQVIPRGKIGLRYDSLDNLESRLAAVVQEAGDRGEGNGVGDSVVQRVERGTDAQGRPTIVVVDRHGNTFLCRDGGNPVSDPSLQQPIIRPSDKEEWGQIAEEYGCRAAATECRGIDFVEFLCPVGTADKIALFYDSVLDATTSVLRRPGPDGAKVAMVAVGNVDATGRADQALLFRETSKPIPPYDGHHVALYVGESSADFEQAFKNCEMANVVWVNPRFDDKAATLQGAKQWKQFRFKNIVDMETGDTIFELEHEMRSIEHSAWPGRYRAS